MSESETSKTPRNAAAGAKQAQAAERPVHEATELTKRNAEYMRQMRKSLDATALSGEKKTAVLNEMTSAIGGLGVAKLFEYLMPAKDGKKVSLWKKIAWSVLAIIVWMLVFTTMSMIQGPLNPVLPGIAYLIIAVVVFFARMWLKRRFNITTSMF